MIREQIKCHQKTCLGFHTSNSHKFTLIKYLFHHPACLHCVQGRQDPQQITCRNGLTSAQIMIVS